MSIISEALKKIQKAEENRPHLLTPSTPSPIQGVKKWFFFLAAVFIVGFFFRSALQSKPAGKNLVNDKKAALEPMNSPQQSNPRNPFPRLTTLPRDEFQLTGIALMDGKNFAIINGDIFQEGDQIQGAKLIRVSKDNVTLDREGNEIHLSLK